MRYSKVTGFISLGLTLFPLTFHIGRVGGDDCSNKSEPCVVMDDCCLNTDWLVYSNGTCQYCRYKNYVCNDSLPCCDPMYPCKDGVCPCANDGNPCTDDQTCCNGVCVEGYCMSCRAKGHYCGKGPTNTSCCPNLTCYGDTCVTCAAEGGVCSDTVPCCNDNLTCYDVCVNCTRENSTCGEGFKDCCTGLNCSKDICQNCSAPYAKCGGVLSLFNTNFALKQLVGFAVVIVAAGLL